MKIETTEEDLDTPDFSEYFEVVELLDNLGYGHLEDFLSVCGEEVPDREKLLITKSWPIKTFVAAEISGNADFWIYELKRDYLVDLHLLSALLNSTLGRFYFEMKYQLDESNYSIELQHLNQFPVPDLKDGPGIGKLLEATLQLRSSDLGSLHCQDLEEKVDAKGPGKGRMRILSGGNYYSAHIEIRYPEGDELGEGEIEEDFQVIVASQERGLRFLDLTKAIIVEHSPNQLADLS